MALCLLSERGVGLPLVLYKGRSHVVLREGAESAVRCGFASLYS